MVGWVRQLKWSDLVEDKKWANLVEVTELVEVSDLVEVANLVEEKKSADLVEVTSGWGKNRSVESTSKSK